MTSSFDLYVQAKEIPDNINNHKVIAWDELSVNFRWFNGGSTVDAYLIQGSAFVTFQYTSATVNVLSNVGQFTTFNGQALSNNPISFTGTKFTLVNQNKATYVVYTLSPITISVTSAGFSTSGQWSGIIRFAALPSDPAAAAALDAASGTYATSTSVSYEIVGEQAFLTYQWNVVAGNPAQLLNLAFLHQRQILQNPNYVPSVSFLTVKGNQVGVLGNKWVLQYTLPTVSWFAPRSVDPSCVQAINQALNNDVAGLTVLQANDFYRFGGAIAAQARLALIAEELGRWDLIPTILNILKQGYAPWFTGTGANPAGYDTLWGGVISSHDDEFGNQIYNDHHFHYGYHLFTGAVIGRFDGAWFNQHASWFSQLARDIGNPSSADPSFTTVRHYDWFHGHSWASGIGNGAGSRDEESSTEGINGYYGLYLYALVAKNCQLQNLARLLLAAEVHGVQTYWHMDPHATGETAYPEQGVRNLVTIGNVMDFQAGAWLFWGAQKLEISGIQMLPYTAITGELVIDQNWGKNAYAYTQVEFNDPTVGSDWKNLMYMAHAVWDPVTAFQEALTVSQWGSGNSFSNTLWFIATRASTAAVSGRVCVNAPQTGANIFQGLLYSVSAGQYVSVGTDALARANSGLSGATVFKFNNVQGTQIQNVANGQYASADNSGTSTVIVNRQAPSTWETFTFFQLNGYYVIRAQSNSQYLSIGAGGALINNINAASPSQVPVSGQFHLVCQNGASTCAGPTPITYPYTANNASIVNSPPTTC
eukprot:Phypoly_transcript_02507.p1 GENE.Phypoly_transcript_02507~~Phypoly_transcript_02507.p1  ORF type:complete len:762 (+),score=155.94 Phypoly_transcript_02507:445-2730(+)